MTESANAPVTVKIMPEDTGAMVGRMLIAFGVTTATALILIWVQRKASAPDFYLTARMRSLDIGAKAADRQAKFWGDLSRRLTNAYLESRP